MNPLNEKSLNEKEIRDLLTPRERPVPPADLAERIKSEIPEDLPAISDLDDDGVARRGAARRGLSGSRLWLMAASVLVAVGGGFLAFRLMDQVPRPGESPATVTDAVTTDAVDAVAATEVAGDVGAEGAEVTRGTLDPAAPPAKKKTDADAVRRPAAVAPEDGYVAGKDAREAPESAKRAELARRPAGADRETQPAAPAPSPGADSVPEGAGEALRQQLGESEVEDVYVSPNVETVGRHNMRPAASPPPPPPPPPPASPARRPRANENQRIEYGNAQIKRMEAEARKLEAELKALEQAPNRQLAAPPSTGGTAEPNDAPYGDMFFDSAGTNPFIDTEDDALSTFGLDVDTGSYTVVRRYLEDGHLPPPDAVRVEEFINFFDYGDAPPEKGEFAIHAEGAPSIYGESERYHLLRFNLSGREIDDSDRRPAMLTFVVDVSGSMGRENRLGLVKQALGLLIDQLHADDRLALVIYGSRGEVVLEPTSDHRAIRNAIERLHTSGATNAEEGLTLAYELAARHRRRGAINRVILCSDGVANVGATSAGSILDRIRHEADQGIELTTVGFGMGNYNDTLMEQLADTGNGRYAYVDTLKEARRVFVENLTGTLQTLAAEARVQVEFDPATVARYRLLGYENRDIADERFRDDTVDAGEIGVGHQVTALYEVKLHRELAAADRVAVLHLRYASIDDGKMVEVDRAVTGADFARRWQAASPALKLTSLVAEYAEILKRTYWAKEGDLEDVFRRAQRVSADYAGDRDVADFVSLVGRAAEYRERERR